MKSEGACTACGVKIELLVLPVLPVLLVLETVPGLICLAGFRSCCCQASDALEEEEGCQNVVLTGLSMQGVISLLWPLSTRLCCLLSH